MHDKKYLVKLYRDGTYMGVLPYIVDDFEYSQDINTAGSQITVKMGTDLKKAGITVDVDYLVTNLGNHVVDNNGNRIITRKDYLFATVPVDLGNQVDIWLYYGNNINGTRVFSGLVSSWEADEDDATITMTALSWGVQLDNYMVEISPGSAIVSYPTYNTSDFIFKEDFKFGPYNRTVRAGQTFQLLSTATISSISLWLGNGGTNGMTGDLSVYLGTPGSLSTLIGNTSHAVAGSSSVQKTTFTFTTPIVLTGATTYTAVLSAFGGVDYAIEIGRNSANPYASGAAYTYNDSTATWTAATGDYAIEIITSSGAIGNQFLSKDPGDIIVSLLDSFTNAGGVVDSSTTSVGSTGTLVSYTFKENTVLDGIKKCVELAPPNWYWYVDVGSNVVYFQHYSLSPDHIFIKGQHINKLKVKYSLEDVKNKVRFTGGEDPSTPGINVVSQKANSTSVSKYGQWLETDSDNRVTTQTTADLIANNTLGEYAKPRFTTSCTVLASRYDIETLHLGQMVGFRNFNDLTNSLVLQIVSISRTPDTAALTLATLPPSQTHRIEDIKRNLDAVITQNNPAQ